VSCQNERNNEFILRLIDYDELNPLFNYDHSMTFL